MPNAAGSGLPNPARYTVLGIAGCQIVRDDVTELYWQPEAPSLTYTWQQAKDYCSSLKLAGISGWRLPSLVELFSLIDDTTSGVNIDSAAFPAAQGGGGFWSSSVYAGTPNYAWGVSFSGGFTGKVIMTDSIRVRCVR
jgi:hypothetical protein